MVADLAGAPWSWDEHVYTSMFWILVGNAALFVGIALLMTAAVLVQRLATSSTPPPPRARDHAGVLVLRGVHGALAMFGIVHLLPHR
jgi:heme/copper-type cytochrome/quinol oxidase subunit 3